MELSSLKSAFEVALHVKLCAIADEFPDSPIRRLEVGVFPWYGSLELSLLFANDECSETDIAAWPHYNISQLNEGRWPEAFSCCREMRLLWEANTGLSKAFFQLVAEAVKSQKVQSAIGKLAKSDCFTVTLFDPDNKNSENYNEDHTHRALATGRL